MFSSISNLQDVEVKMADIQSDHLFGNPKSALHNHDQISTDEYIGVTNQNAEGETHIYRRTEFTTNHINPFPWDGLSIDVSWYDKEKDEYVITKAEHLAGLKHLIEESGETFEGKTIRLGNNIDLVGYEWEPIGNLSIIDRVGGSTDFYFEVEADSAHTFSGTLDGNGYCIFGLRITHVNKDLLFNGLFRSAKNAYFKNIIICEAELGSLSERKGYYASLVGYADSCRFINVTVTGRMRAQHCGGIACITADSTFRDCSNYMSITSSATHNGSCIMIGGFSLQSVITPAAVKRLNNREPVIFDHCIQNGKIEVDCKDVATLYIGQLYAQCPVLSGEEDSRFGFNINRCIVGPSQITEVSNVDSNALKGIFYAKKGDTKDFINHASTTKDKTDLLSGLIGKTDQRISITVRKLICPRVVQAMTIPGSINILRSDSGSRSFITKDVGPLTKEDEIYTLDPFFKYIKTIKS